MPKQTNKHFVTTARLTLQQAARAALWLEQRGVKPKGPTSLVTAIIDAFHAKIIKSNPELLRTIPDTETALETLEARSLFNISTARNRPSLLKAIEKERKKETVKLRPPTETPEEVLKRLLNGE